MHRKFIFVCLFASFLISLTIITGCDDSSTTPSSGGFYFKLTVVDQSGAPLSDLNISRRCRIEYDDPVLQRNQAALQPLAGADVWPVTSLRPVFEKTYAAPPATLAEPFYEFTLDPARPNPGTSTTFITMNTVITGDCNLEISVLDWADQEVGNFSVSMFEGLSSVSLGYAFTDASYANLPNGIFRSVFTVTETATSAVLFADSVYFCGYTDRDPFRQSIGHTNGYGWFSTRDKGIFPSLQGQQPQMGRDGTGAELGLFSFSNTIDVKVMTELPPLTEGVVYWMTRELVITEGKNEFEWVFVPDDSILVME